MRFAISLLTAALAAVAAAVPQSGGSPSGNPIAKPGLNEQVKAGEPFTITWQVRTLDTLALKRRRVLVPHETPHACRCRPG